MQLFRMSCQNKALRRLAFTFVFAVMLASCQDCALADEVRGFVVLENPGEEAGVIDFVKQLIVNLFDGQALMQVLGKPEFMLFALVAVNVIVFVETGLLVGCFLPGDSLLVITGLVCAGSWSPSILVFLLLTLSLSAIIGDSIGYSIGFKTGPKIFSREKSLFFHKDHLLKAQQFYVNHGGKTIILARFIPILRTFAPVVAGVGKMEYRQFLFFNVIGGVSWVCSMLLAGYFLPSLLNGLLTRLFGQPVQVEHHVEKVVIVVVLLSIAPGLFAWLKTKLTGKAVAPREEPTAIAK